MLSPSARDADPQKRSQAPFGPPKARTRMPSAVAARRVTAARSPGLDHRTLGASLDEGVLSRRVRGALERALQEGIGSAADRQRERNDGLEKRLEELEGVVEAQGKEMRVGRRALEGEYYTPTWLVRAMIRELVDAPLNQRVLDPACGSGTFVAEAVAHFLAAARAANWEPKEVLNGLREAVTGIDVHPVAVHLARAAWTLAARPAINTASAAGIDASLSIPVYLGDALQLRFRTGDMFAEHQITIQTRDEENTDLVFPVSLVERAEEFDALMGDVSAYIERGDDPFLALDDNHVNDPTERQIIGNTIAAMQRLHDGGRNHIWAYYTRNMVRPVALSRSKVDVVIGNPPWINYNQTADVLRTELQNLSRSRYGIWAGGRYATHQDVAGLFFARSVDLYLKDGGVIGFVLPHSALQAGQYSKWRSGQWRARKSGPSVQVDFTLKPAWDLEQLEPNDFFPVPASVAFARKLSQDATGRPLAGSVDRWRGKAGAKDVRRESSSVLPARVRQVIHLTAVTPGRARS